MVLTKKQEQVIKKMPYIETKVSKSKDGQYLIHRTVITHVRPLSYYEAVLNNEEVVAEEDLTKELEEALA